MESQDGISVRPMRLKVLYTFDDANKTNCLARWPQLLDIQTAFLDEQTQIGVIELKTCIQAIVSASPELVAKLGQDYTVYAYDYSEYETPLVGQGMLSWVLASSSPTPNAPAHQSRTMVTGRVCKNVLGLFSRGAQETLEVKLRLVPVPTAMQSEYLNSMQKYRELSNVIPHEFDAQVWTDFLRQNPDLMSPTPQPAAQALSPMDHSGIERFHQLLSEGSTPRDISMPNAPFRSTSPTQSALSTISRVQTPGQFQAYQQEQPIQRPQPERTQSDVIRPSSSASMRDVDFNSYARPMSRRGSVQSGYGSCEETSEQQPRKRAKLYRAEAPGRSDLNIERQPSSLRVAASTAASVRIHRPTPINPSITAAQSSNEEPIRPPTPISGLNSLPRRARPQPSLLRESSVQSLQSFNQYTSPYPMSDDQPPMEPNAHSPEESRYQGLFEPSFTMPSSPPVLDYGLPTRSSPVLPPMAADLDSGFMSGGIDDLLDEEPGPTSAAPVEDATGPSSKNTTSANRTVRSAAQASSPAPVAANPEPQTKPIVISDEPIEKQPQVSKEAPIAPARATKTASRPASRASSVRPTTHKPLAPAPISQSELEQLLSSIPASDPVAPTPAGDSTTAETPAPQPANKDGKIRSGAGARRVKQVQARLEKCIQDGQVPPYCENCGAIETPTWRRAHSKEIAGSEEEANELTKDPAALFWQTVERDEKEKVIKFKVYKKTLAEADQGFDPVLLCNPCGLWLHKFKTMRPENRWTKPNATKKKRPRSGRRPGGPLSTNGTARGARNRSDSAKPDASSPGGSDASTPPADDDATPRADAEMNTNVPADDEREKGDDSQEPSPKRRRANSVEPRKTSDMAKSRWHEDDAIEALRRAIQSSPARNLANRDASAPGEKNLTPKPVRRVLFPNSQNDGGPLKALGPSVLNSPKRSSRASTAQDADKQSGDKENATNDLDRLFESPSFEFDLCASPTPKRRNQRSNLGDKRHSLPSISPVPKARKGAGPDTTPTRLSAQRLQRVQSSPGSMSRLSLTPNRSRSRFPDLPPLADDVFGPGAFQGMDDMIVDIFSEDATSAIHTDPLFALDSRGASNTDWANWLPSDCVSPLGSDKHHNDENSTDVINALLSDPDIQKDLFQYADATALDSGFFSSDALQGDMTLGEKADASTNQTSNTEQV
ncbi:hypothetical protein BJX62DRAFT_214969 [Aspergillus germanicus]